MPNDPLQEAHARALVRVLVDEDLNDLREVNVENKYQSDKQTLAARKAQLKADREAMWTALDLPPKLLNKVGDGLPPQQRTQARATAVWKHLFSEDFTVSFD